jgi:hypothetical protein
MATLRLRLKRYRKEDTGFFTQAREKHKLFVAKVAQALGEFEEFQQPHDTATSLLRTSYRQKSRSKGSFARAWVLYMSGGR